MKIILFILRAVLAGPSLVSSPVCPSCLAPLHPPLLPCTKYDHGGDGDGDGVGDGDGDGDDDGEANR